MPKIDSVKLKEEIKKHEQANTTPVSAAFNLGLTTATMLVEAEEKFEKIRGGK